MNLPDVAPDPKTLYSTLTEVISEGVLLVDRAGRVRSINRAGCILFDLAPPADRILGLSVLEATHLRLLAELAGEAIQSGESQQIEVKQVGRSGRTLKVRALPLPTNSGGGCLLVLTDISEFLRIQAIRTDFVANVSHELRTPLTSIRATAETLLDGAASDPEYGKRFLNNIIRESDRLTQLAADLLELARVDSKQREMVRFDLRFLVSEVGGRLSGFAERREVTLNLPENGPSLGLEADYHEIDQVVYNLTENAIKYTPAGGAVTLRIEERPAEGRVAFIVSDTGIGILSQDLPRIFERFWRADRARRFQSGDGSTSGGTGLGLSIVKHIVEAHGGVVTAESELGRGSRFTVLLPMSATPPTPEGAASKSDSHAEE